jgi:hypothetical protein
VIPDAKNIKHHHIITIAKTSLRVLPKPTNPLAEKLSYYVHGMV